MIFHVFLFFLNYIIRCQLITHVEQLKKMKNLIIYPVMCHVSTKSANMHSQMGQGVILEFFFTRTKSKLKISHKVNRK